MRRIILLVWMVSLPLGSRAAPPAAVVTALEYLPDGRRPAQESSPMLKSTTPFEAVADDTYVARGKVRPAGAGKSDDDESTPAFDVVITLHLSGGMVRDYDVTIEGSRAVSRARVQ